MPQHALIDLPKLITAYFAEHPDPAVAEQQVVFGTSGHRGSSLRRSFNEDHIAAIAQAICDYRYKAGINGPIFLGRDTHALSLPAFVTAREVFAANDIIVLVDSRDGYTPTPAISRAILSHNAHSDGLADGIVVTSSHNPPEEGGFKYNSPDGGPAASTITTKIQHRANVLLGGRLREVRRIPWTRAKGAATTASFDFMSEYVRGLPSVLDLDSVRAAGICIGADPLGGASVAYWAEIAERFRLNLTVLNQEVDPTFRFMALDWDGNIRMDCSSPHVMAPLIDRRTEFDIVTGNDTDADRHGIITPDGGLMDPNHYLAVAIDYLYRHREGWPSRSGVGKTLVSSSIIDRVTADLGRRLVEVPVGFKWFVSDLRKGLIAFGGEESAGASFLCRDGQVWTTDKDGIQLALLASEIKAITGRTPSEYYCSLTARLGEPTYARIDAPATPAQKAALAQISPDKITARHLAGEPIRCRLTTAPGNDEPLHGLKIVTDSGWFAARPSGTEDLYKLYAESFQGASHLARIQEEAQEMLQDILRDVHHRSTNLE